MRDFPGGIVGENPPANAGNMIKQVNPWSGKIPHASEQLNPMCHSYWSPRAKKEKEGNKVWPKLGNSLAQSLLNSAPNPACSSKVFQSISEPRKLITCPKVGHVLLWSSLSHQLLWSIFSDQVLAKR